jgi:hypothetical protein
MKKISRSIWFGMAIVIVAIVAASVLFFHGDDVEVVTVETIVSEREQFEAMHPLKSKPDTKVETEKFIQELSDRNRSYAATSKWNGKIIAVQGYWNSPFEGCSISNKTSDQDEEYLLMNPGSDFQLPRSTISRFLPRFLQHSQAFVMQDDFVKITGVYHATNYNGHWGLMESTSWLEFHKIERWDQSNRRWQRVYSW